MEIVTEASTSTPPVGGSAVTIGAYDGVHLGHRALLAELRARAGERGLATVVVTFDRHPATVVRPESAPKLLCDLDQKLELLEAAGVDRTVVVHFDEERANETAEDFVEVMLVEGLDARLVVVGEDFHFGHGRKGNVALLREMGSTAGFAVEGVLLEADPGPTGSDLEPISSTRIRKLVGGGRVEEAAVLLGRPHQVRGTVAFRRWGSTPAGTGGRTDRSTRLRCPWGGGRPSTAPTATCWWRRSCSTSPVTSTASRPRCPSWTISATRWPSTTWTTSSSRWRPTWWPPGNGWAYPGS
jgi:FAD synthetase